MSVVGHQPPPFFKRGPAPLARLAFFVVLSLALLVFDLKYRYLELARQGVAAVLYPVQRAAYAPVDLYGQLTGYFGSLKAAQQENEQFRRKELESANWLLRQQHLEQENQRLRALLDMKTKQPVPGTLAEILYTARDPFSRRVVVDRGGQHDVVAGQAVVDESGVLGQVTRVFPLQSEVTLITDKNQAVPVKLVRNGLRSVLFGAHAGQLELRFLAANADVQPGDLLVTSGLDGIYQPGLPVAKVSRVDRDAAYSFARILCEPVAGVEKHGQVLILGAREPLPPQIEEAEARDKPSKGRKAKRKEQAAQP
ncbi:MAG: Cell shape-determining protein MreC [Rhodocyclaceae bacterium]|nr:MAG: rod shape-determining protein MreC [Rhodocyclaceae bacterium]MBE7423176.1 rod shape-determining protein MreC [Zoogloeaceae bacterium]MBV6406745.1 Cell shape-determining protein MreC [Rhodocyclaceae bacterium]MCC6878867.1 rod shape-determining protein MreC [Rhodocyclaceae bacterium]MCK6384591.1 rod shape-determining protein MreC [Rhodocyclaceae bacterium]